jgi:hypothetical protein
MIILIILLLDSLIVLQDPAEKTRLFRAIETIPCIQQKANWAQQWIKCNELHVFVFLFFLLFVVFDIMQLYWC